MENKTDIRHIELNGSEYKRELELRDKILRKPLGLSIFHDDLENERKDYHIGFFINNELVGIVILTELDSIEIKIRQLAVEESLRGNNIGTKLVIYAEQLARDLGYKKILLNSRKTAVLFYQKLGYEKISKEFIEVTIPHYKMEKKLE